MKILQQHKLITLIFIIVVLILLVVINAILPKSKNSPSSQVNTTSAQNAFGEQSQTYINNMEQINQKDQQTLNESAKVGQLLKLVPYTGSYFSLDYNYDTGDFILKVDPNHKTEGNQEFDQFLQNNGVQSRSWIKDIITE